MVQTKALFRCVFAYSNGRPVKALDIRRDEEFGELRAIENGGMHLEVAVARCSIGTEEPISRAYESFVNNGELDDRAFDWERVEGEEDGL